MPQIILDTNKGLTIPALTTAQKNAIVSPSTGALVYDTTLGAVSDYNGSSWDVATVLADFGNSLASSGYQKLPGGLIIQWGVSSNVTSGGSLAITLPIAFPNAGLRSYISWLQVATGTGFQAGGGSSNPTTTAFTIYNYGSTGGNFSWLALGY